MDTLSLEYARELDHDDVLECYRDEFVVEDPNLIYLDGNSLGRLPRATVERMREVVEREWGERLIRGWNEGWFTAPQRVGAKIAAIIGAREDEVIVGDSTSVNLFKVIVAALQANPGRHKVLTDDLNFPSDIYVMQSAVKLLGPDYRLEIVHSVDGITVGSEALARAIDRETALVALTHTAFKSGFVYDMAAVTEMAHRAGALISWDLCHSAGAMPLALDDSQADLAVGCTYKYLNGGPGSPAFVFVRHDLQNRIVNPIWGWFGQKDQFDFALTYERAPGLTQFLSGTPAILSLAPIETGVDLLLIAGLERIRRKSVKQTEYLISLWQAWLAPLGVQLHSPREANRRGSHVSLGHPEGLRIDQALIQEMNVIPDFRSPDNIRFGLAPLYTSYVDVYEAMSRLRRVLTDKLYEKYAVTGPIVT